MERQTPYHVKRGKRVDGNQAEIVDYFVSQGCSVLDTSALGGGAPDILVGFKGRNVWVEIKTAKGRLSRLQRIFHAAWRGQVAVLRCPSDAQRLLREWS